MDGVIVQRYVSKRTYGAVMGRGLATAAAALGATCSVALAGFAFVHTRGGDVHPARVLAVSVCRPHQPDGIAVLRQRLAFRGSTVNVLVQGDSTGDEPSEWVYKLGVHLAREFPDRTVQYRLWDARGERSYLPSEVLHHGTADGGTINIFNASMPGAIIEYSISAERFREQSPMTSLDAAFINYSHNDSTVGDFRPLVQALVSEIACKFPAAGVVAVTQNPEISPRTPSQIAAQARHARQMRALAAAEDYGLVDANAIFVHAGHDHGIRRYVSTTDGEHPTRPAGRELWVTAVLRAVG